MITGFIMITYRIIIKYILISDIVNKGFSNKNKLNRKKVLIIGAGIAAHQIIKTIHSEMMDKYDIVGIIDDNKERLGFTVSSVKIIGNRDDIVKVCEENRVDEIFFSIAKIDNNNKKQILNICKKTNAKVRILPSIRELVNEKNLFGKLRDVEIEDLLGREPVTLIIILNL